MELALATILFVFLWLFLGALGWLVARTIRKVEEGHRTGRWHQGL